MQQGMVIGNEQETSSVLVEPTNSLGSGCAVKPSTGQQREHGRAVSVVVRTDVTGRFVQGNEDAGGVIEGLAIQDDGAGINPR